MKITIEANSIDELFAIRSLLGQLKNPRETQTTIESLGLDIRTQNCLKAERIDTVEHLTSLPAYRLLMTPNLGRKSLDAIIDALKARGLSLASVDRVTP